MLISTFLQSIEGNIRYCESCGDTLASDSDGGYCADCWHKLDQCNDNSGSEDI